MQLRNSGVDGLADALRANRERLERIVELRLDPRLTGRVDSSDVLQEAFLEAEKRLSRYLQNPIVSPFVWLRGVTLDTLIHVHRRHFAQMRDAGIERSLNDRPAMEVSSISLAGWLVGDLTSPSQAAIREELVAAVAEVLNGMDEIDREILLLRHFEHLNNDEVASIIGVKKAAASRRYMRALGRFRQAVEIIPGLKLD